MVYACRIVCTLFEDWSILVNLGLGGRAFFPLLTFLRSGCVLRCDTESSRCPTGIRSRKTFRSYRPTRRAQITPFTSSDRCAVFLHTTGLRLAIQRYHPYLGDTLHANTNLKIKTYEIPAIASQNRRPKKQRARRFTYISSLNCPWIRHILAASVPKKN